MELSSHGNGQSIPMSPMVRGRLSAGVSVLVAIIAIVVSKMGAGGSASMLDKLGEIISKLLESVGSLLFYAMKLDVTRLAVPIAFSRMMMRCAKDEGLPSRATYSIVAASVTYFALKRLSTIDTDDTAPHRSIGTLCNLVGLKDHGLMMESVLEVVCVHLLVYLHPWLTSSFSASLPDLAGFLLMSLLAAGASITAGVSLLTSPGTSLRCLGAALGGAGVYFSCRARAGRPGPGLRMSIIAGLAAIGGLFAVLPALGNYLMPVADIHEAFEAILAVSTRTKAQRELLLAETCIYLYTTIHLQISLGFMGIGYITKTQERVNMLIALGNDSAEAAPSRRSRSGKAASFRRAAFAFLLFQALPYFLCRASMENITKMSEVKLRQLVDTCFRANLFAGDDPDLANGGQGGLMHRLQAVSKSKFTNPSSYTKSLDTIMTSYSGVFHLIDRKLFSVPKMALFPHLLIQQPLFVATALPISMALDACQAAVVSVVTQNAQSLTMESQRLNAELTKIEQHDIRYEDLIRFNDAAEFTRQRWLKITDQINRCDILADTLTSFRMFLKWLYWQDGLTVGIEILIAHLMESGDIKVTGIGVYKRVIEDVIDTLLMRSRADAELASVRSESHKLRALAAAWSQKESQDPKRPRRLACSHEAGRGLALSNLTFMRGATTVHLPELTLEAGRVYAVTGPNGCGKSSTFAVLSAGSCLEKPVDLPPSLRVAEGASITLGSSQVGFITQQFYCPLNSKPIEWFMKSLVDGNATKSTTSDALVENIGAKVVKLANELKFFEKANFTLETLHTLKEDFYSELSGGQKAKAEFIRQVFLKDVCPGLLLIDEGFAALDPTSKVRSHACRF